MSCKRGQPNSKSNMPAQQRPNSRFSGGLSGSGRPAPNTPMSERQQMALLIQMTSSSNQAELSPGSSSQSNHGRSRGRNELGETKLHTAAIKGDQDAVKKLIDQGCNPNVQDNAGWTPLHEACSNGHYGAAMALIKAGANINVKGLDDETPLHDAVANGNLKLVKMLVERGADRKAKNRKGKTPIDIAVDIPAVLSYLESLETSASTPQRDVGSTGTRTSQHVKKSVTSDTKKVQDTTEHNPSPSSSADNTSTTVTSTSSVPSTSTIASSCSTTSITTVTKPTIKEHPEEDEEEEDIYEFKATPKGSLSSGDDKSDLGKGSDKSSDERSDDQGVVQQKRNFSDVDASDDGNVDEETKRKKRKEGESSATGNKTYTVTGRANMQRVDKTPKTLVNAQKAQTVLQNKNIVVGEKKSPCPSPKPLVSKTPDSDVEMEDKNADGAIGPKVPPLKIVIPQQNQTMDQDVGARSGKNQSNRSHTGLPYIVASASSNSNDSIEKDPTASQCASPASDFNKTGDEKKPSSTEDRAPPRVLRSSNRTGAQSIDRGSNNSSPQLQSSSPSPAAANPESSDNVNAKQTNASSTNSTASPQAASNQSETESQNTNSEASSTNTNPTVEVKSQPVQNPVELHPRKRKIKASRDDNKQNNSSAASTSSNASANNASDNNEMVSINSDIHPHDQPMTNSIQMYMNIRKQIERRQRSLTPVQPKPPQGFKDYLMNRKTYFLAGKTYSEPFIKFAPNLPGEMKDLYSEQARARHRLMVLHIVEKEKLVLAVEQEILRVHGKAARALANQSMPFSVCATLKDEEVYSMITPEQEEKDRNARSRYNGRLFLSWLQDVDDKWEKIKEAMVLRHHNEAESLYAVQKMDWEWKMKEVGLCDYNAEPEYDNSFVPIIHVSDDFDLFNVNVDLDRDSQIKN